MKQGVDNLKKNSINKKTNGEGSITLTVRMQIIT